MDPTSQFLNQGLLGAAVVVLFSVAAYFLKGWINAEKKRADDVLQISINSVDSQKNLLASQQTQQRQIDTIIQILDRRKEK